jgi:Nif-specific regulatory protein
MLSDKDRLDQKILELTTLYEVGKVISSSLDLEQVMLAILRIVHSFMGMKQGTILLYDPATKELSVRVGLGLREAEKRRGTYHVGEGIIGRVMQLGMPLVVPDVTEEPLFIDKTGSHEDLEQQRIAWLAVPIKVKGEAIGVLSADRLFTARIPYQEDLRVLTIVASLIGQTVELHRLIAQEKQDLLERNLRLQQELRVKYRPANIVAQSKKMEEVFRAIDRVSGSRATVLIRGESGTGKELVARAVHYGSARAEGPFIKLNCAALPGNLLESELFGHEKGAFTGALQAKKGRFELADGGTIFLDEVGDIPVGLQVKLLRVLQERKFERVGGTKTITVDVRIIAATNKDLEQAVRDGGFREDLYYRLNVVPMYLPPLRDRREDIPALIGHFLERFNGENGKMVKVSAAAMDLLMEYEWPGNVRELENCIERMVVMAQRDLVAPEEVPIPINPFAPQPPPSPRWPGALPGPRSLEEVAREQIHLALKQCGGVQSRAATLLGLTPRQLGYRLRKYGIGPSRTRPQASPTLQPTNL